MNDPYSKRAQKILKSGNYIVQILISDSGSGIPQIFSQVYCCKHFKVISKIISSILYRLPFKHQFSAFGYGKS